MCQRFLRRRGDGAGLKASSAYSKAWPHPLAFCTGQTLLLTEGWDLMSQQCTESDGKLSSRNEELLLVSESSLAAGGG